MKQQAHESDEEMLARLDKENYDSLPIHLKFLEHFWIHQWHDWEHWEIDCWYEWYEEDWDDSPDIHEISDWIESEVKSRIQALWDGWIPLTEGKPTNQWDYLVKIKWRWVEVKYATVYFKECGIEFQNADVTHWMPLPLPPNK